MRKLFITGIDTEVGKTLVSAIFVEALFADYWKPIQSGASEARDTQTVKQLISNNKSVFHKESYIFDEPVSPHEAAALSNTSIQLDRIQLPGSENHTIVIEGAGGLLVPLNESETILNLILALDLEVVLVSKNYLGSINHTLLSYEMLRANKCKIAGIVFNNSGNRASENAILAYTGLNRLLDVKFESSIDKATVKHYASLLKL